ncbi:MAG: outer membrane protein assembly factor BamE [Pseudomonadota bacterium]|mgnify:CR=1 FL=1
MRHDWTGSLLRPVLFAGAASVLLGACTPQVRVHGFVPTADELDLIEPGLDTQDSVADRIGRPANSNLLGDPVWYYVQSRMEQLTYNPPRETDRQVVVIAFTEDGLVKSIDRFGLEGGRVIDLNTRVTVTDPNRLGILQQFLGNLFNLNAEQLFNNS